MIIMMPMKDSVIIPAGLQMNLMFGNAAHLIMTPTVISSHLTEDATPAVPRPVPTAPYLPELNWTQNSLSPKPPFTDTNAALAILLDSKTPII